jgi:hypothetical protein
MTINATCEPSGEAENEVISPSTQIGAGSDALPPADVMTRKSRIIETQKIEACLLFISAHIHSGAIYSDEEGQEWRR